MAVSAKLKQLAFSIPLSDGPNRKIILIFDESIPANLPRLAVVDNTLVVLPKSPREKNTRYRHGDFQFETARNPISGNWTLLVDGHQFAPLALNEYRLLDLDQIRNLPLGPANESASDAERRRRLNSVGHKLVASPVPTPLAMTPAPSAGNTVRVRAETTQLGLNRRSGDLRSGPFRLALIGLLAGLPLGAVTTRYVRQVQSAAALEQYPWLGLLFPIIAGVAGGVLGLGATLVISLSSAVRDAFARPNPQRSKSQEPKRVLPKLPVAPTIDAPPEEMVDYHAATEVPVDPGEQRTVPWSANPGEDEIASETTVKSAQNERTFGDYKRIEKIAPGGMGVVYKAQQQSLNRVVALKFIRSADHAEPQEVRRFLMETEHAAPRLAVRFPSQ